MSHRPTLDEEIGPTEAHIYFPLIMIMSLYM